MNNKNRFDLEEQMSNVNQIGADIETIIYAIGDSPIKHTEDQLLNMLIGIKQLHETRYQEMWYTFEDLVKSGAISNKNTDTELPPYDDVLIRTEASDDK